MYFYLTHSSSWKLLLLLLLLLLYPPPTTKQHGCMCPVNYNFSIFVATSSYVGLTSIASVEKLKIINCIFFIYSSFNKKMYNHCPSCI